MFDLLRMVVPIMAFGIIGFVAVFMFITITKMAERHREFRVRDSEFSVIVSGDRGRLTFQGSRFVRFERIYS